MSREAQVRFCESVRVKFPRATHLICHCVSEAQARALIDALGQRPMKCHLELHPHKTKIVYCKDANRRDSYPEQRFDFLGYTFRPRSSKNRTGKLFVSFAPAVSEKAAKAIRCVAGGFIIATILAWQILHQSNRPALVLIPARKEAPPDGSECSPQSHSVVGH